MEDRAVEERAVEDRAVEDMAGKVAVVTGGASGIGRATAERLADEGARVVVVDVDTAQGPRVADAVSGRFAHVDVSDPGAWLSLVADVVATEGTVDLAHLNAGVTTGEPDIRALTEEQYRRIMGVNLDGVVYGTRALAAAMTERDGGAIVATASIAGLLGFPPDPIYTLTKHGVIGLVRALGPVLAPLGVRISAVCPGLVDTPLIGPEGKQRLEEFGFPLMPASQIAEAVVTAMRSPQSGQAWVCQPGREAVPFEFGQVPGPRTEGASGMPPPPEMQGNR